MKGNQYLQVGRTGIALWATILTALTGCVGYVERPRATVYVEPAVVIEQDDYVYYPRYQMYYGNRSHLYYYQEGPSWVSRSAPRGVTVGVLFATPSVSVGFHDGPATHHADVLRTYPKNWKQPGNSTNRKQGQRGPEKRDHNR